MSKVAIVYWSGTGNTEAMADLIAQGVRAALPHPAARAHHEGDGDQRQQAVGDRAGQPHAVDAETAQVRHDQHERHEQQQRPRKREQRRQTALPQRLEQRDAITMTPIAR